MSTAAIGIVDYGMANLRSVQKAFERVGARAVIFSDAATVANCDKLVLPGVGAFRDAITRLRDSGLIEPLLEHIKRGKPFLGICLGLQMLFTRSTEDGEHRGIDLYAGDVVRFPPTPGLKVPHMGWNELRFTKPCPLFRGLPEQSAVYFVHSYFAVPADAGLTCATAEYPTPFTAAIWQGNVFATQFHPEKSQQVGLTMLRNFANLD